MGKIFSRKNLYLYDHCYVGRYLKKKKKLYSHERLGKLGNRRKKQMETNEDNVDKRMMTKKKKIFECHTKQKNQQETKD